MRTNNKLKSAFDKQEVCGFHNFYCNTSWRLVLYLYLTFSKNMCDISCYLLSQKLTNSVWCLKWVFWLQSHYCFLYASVYWESPLSIHIVFNNLEALKFVDIIANTYMIAPHISTHFSYKRKGEQCTYFHEDHTETVPI